MLQFFWEKSCARGGKKHRGILFAEENISDFPVHGLKCAECGEMLRVENWKNFVMLAEAKIIPLTEFVDKTLGAVKKAYEERDDAVYKMPWNPYIHNDKYIDLFEQGWLDTRDGGDDNYVIQEGDKGFFKVSKYFHRACYRYQLNVLHKMI